jgi:hypothetical protein
MLNVEEMKSFPLKSIMRQVYSLFSINLVLELLARTRQEKKIKGSKVQKEGVKISMLANDMILYLKNHKDSIKNLLDMKNTFSSVAEYKSI